MFKVFSNLFKPSKDAEVLEAFGDFPEEFTGYFASMDKYFDIKESEEVAYIKVSTLQSLKEANTARINATQKLCGFIQAELADKNFEHPFTKTFGPTKKQYLNRISLEKRKLRKLESIQKELKAAIANSGF